MIAPAPSPGKTAIQAALAAGLQHHQAGRLTEAGQCYNQALAVDARQADALHLLGVIAHQTRNHQRAAARIIADGIDILVDLSGHTNGNRLPLFAGRAAPVQATWLGFWGTTGLPAMDYILSDADTIPPGREAHYSERVLRLPGSRFCYQPPDYAPRP
jgi:hypothetical protein